MQRSWAMILTLLVAGCMSAQPVEAPPKVSGEALCDGLDPLVNAHASALAADGGDRSVVTGQALIASYDAGCFKARGPR